MNNDLKCLLERADACREAIAASRPWSISEEAVISQFFRENMVYAYGHLSGSPLMLGDIRQLLSTGVTGGDHPICYYAEAVSYAEAHTFAMDIAQRKPFRFTETDIRLLHELLFAAYYPREAGRYRDEIASGANGSIHPAPHMIPYELTMLPFRQEKSRERLHPIVWASDIFLDILRIQPFARGNTRIASLLMNAALDNTGYMAAIIPPVWGVDYASAVRSALSRMDYSPSQCLLASCVLEAQRDVARLLGIRLPE